MPIWYAWLRWQPSLPFSACSGARRARHWAWRIKLVDYSGNVPGAGRGVVRCLGALFSALCLGLGYLWCLIDRNHRYWHDYLSRTELILLPKRPRKERKP